MKWTKEIIINLQAILVGKNETDRFVNNSVNELVENDISLQKLKNLEKVVLAYIEAQETEWKYDNREDSSNWNQKEGQRLLDLTCDRQDDLFKHYDKYHTNYEESK